MAVFKGVAGFMSDGSGSLHEVIGGSASSTVSSCAQVFIERSADGVWICDIDESRVSAWKASYMSKGYF